MEHKLSICIPTYNRASMLFETLCAFLPQVESRAIEICISDNSENTETETAVKEFSKKYPYVRYQRNSSNIGVDRNFCAVVSMAKTDYVWIFCDDDRPLEGAIDTVCEKLLYNPTVIMVNSQPMTENMEPMGKKNMTGIELDKWYDNPEQFLEDLSWYSTFVGGLVVRKSEWDSVEPQKYFDTAFVHIGIIYEMLVPQNARALFLSKTLIGYRTGQTSWYKDFIVILFKNWPKVIYLLPSEYSLTAKEKAVLSGIRRFVSLDMLFFLKKSGILNFNSLNTYIIPFWKKQKNKFGLAGSVLLNAVLCLCMPTMLLRCLRKIIKTLFSGVKICLNKSNV